MVLAAPEEVGMDADRLARADSAIAHAVLAGATPAPRWPSGVTAASFA